MDGEVKLGSKQRKENKKGEKRRKMKERIRKSMKKAMRRKDGDKEEGIVTREQERDKINGRNGERKSM
jgi:hypothetical protein